MKRKAIILILFISTLSTFAADKIRGYIFDEKKQPVIGANIYWENSQKGVSSDTNGFFEIDPPKGHEHLVVTYTGYVPQHVHIEDANKEIQVFLKEDTKLLDEVVISKRSPGTVTQRSSILQS